MFVDIQNKPFANSIALIQPDILKTVVCILIWRLQAQWSKEKPSDEGFFKIHENSQVIWFYLATSVNFNSTILNSVDSWRY